MEVHNRNDDDGLLFNAVDNAVWKLFEATAAYAFIKELPCSGILDNSLNRLVYFIQKFSSKLRAIALVKVCRSINVQDRWG